MATIQERLRELDRRNRCETIVIDGEFEEAATHIDALEKRVGELEDALKDIAGASWGLIYGKRSADDA